MTKWVFLLAACSGTAGRTTPVGPAAGTGSAAPVADIAVTEHDCDELFAHVTTLVAAERNATRPDQPTSEADQTEQRGIDHAQRMTECRALPRTAIECALAARTSEAVAACDRDQATRSSSTSNSSVAPGGMTPAAPRSP